MNAGSITLIFPLLLQEFGCICKLLTMELVTILVLYPIILLCRVCNVDIEGNLIDIGCQCKGGLEIAHRTFMDTWFRTRGSN